MAVAGVAALFQGMKLLTEPGLKRFVVIPVTINVAVFAILLWVAIDQFEALIAYLMPQLPDWLSWLSWLLWIVFGAASVLLVFFSFSVVANLIAAPFNGLLAEAVERHLTGQAPPDGNGLTAALKAAPGAIVDEIRKLLYFAKWAIPLLLLFLIPVINVAAPFLWALFTAWMLALEYSDYPLGNRGMKGAEQRAALRSRRLAAFGFGGAVMVATMIPLLNFLVMPAAVAGATALWVKRLPPPSANA